MKNSSELIRRLTSWAPTLLIVIAAGAAGWVIFTAYLKTIDGALSQDRITAQEERLNTKTYSQFETQFLNTNTTPEVLPTNRNPFSS